MKNKYVISVDNFVEEAFYELEKLSEEGEGHWCVMIADTKEEAAEKLATRLIPFIADSMIER